MRRSRAVCVSFSATARHEAREVPAPSTLNSSASKAKRPFLGGTKPYFAP